MQNRRAIVCGGLFLGTLLLFSRAIGHGFLDYDDPDFVTTNVHVQAGLSWEGLRWAFTSGGYAANWQPLTWLSLMLDRQLYGDRAWGFHATSVGWHALNAVMAFLALRRLTGAFWTSASIAALFAWHPLRVESVAWISERKDVLSVFFGLLALWAYAAFAEKSQGGGIGARRFYFLSLGAFTLSLLSKAMLVTLPCLLLLLDGWPLRRLSLGTLRPLIVEKIPFFLLSISSGVVTYAVQEAGGAVNHGFALGPRLANAIVSVARYLGKFFWPFDLAVCYPFPLHWPFAAVAGALLLILALTALAWIQWRRRPWLLAGWLWFLGMLVPVIGIVQSGSQAMADRYTYLPMLGIQLALLWSLRDANPPWLERGTKVALVGLVLAGCAVRTWNQLSVWQNSALLFGHALAVTEDNYMAHTFLSATLLNEDHIEEAARHCRRALEINPDYAPAHLGLGVALEKSGRSDDALVSYRRALQLRPDFMPAHYRLGSLLLHGGEPAEALAHFQTAAHFQPDFAPLQLGLGLALEQLHRPFEAAVAYERALVLAPGYAAAQNNYANLLVSLHRAAEAWPHYERALQIDPSFAEAQFNYANALRENGGAAEACLHYRQVLALHPLDADVHYGLGVALEQLDLIDEASAAYREAVRLRPIHTEAHYNLGVILLNRDRLDEARGHFESAVRSQPEFGPAYLGLGLIEEQNGQLPQALRYEERAVALAPGNADAHYALGNTLYASDRASVALAQWEEALRLNHDLPGLREKIARVRREFEQAR